MPIKEEPVRIEFQYEQEDAQTSDGMFNVEYYSETEDGKEKKYVRLTPHGTTENSTFELDFLVEVVDFLRKKGVVDAKVEAIPEGHTSRSSLPLPSIQTINMGSSSISEGSLVGIVEHAIPISTSIANGGESQILAPPVINSKPTGPKVIVDAPLAEEAEKLIIKRPVIRTRIGEHEDPMEALEESKRQRGQNPQKSIKRKEEADAV